MTCEECGVSTEGSLRETICDACLDGFRLQLGMSPVGAERPRPLEAMLKQLVQSAVNKSCLAGEPPVGWHAEDLRAQGVTVPTQGELQKLWEREPRERKR